jgi:hypothetical protein
VGYALLAPPSGVSINAGGVITWTPTQAESPGTNTITTVATSTNNFDLVSSQLSVTNSFTVVVREVNVAPTLPVLATQMVNELTLLTVTNTAADTDVHATVGYSLLAAPVGVAVSTNGVITWTPGQTQSPGTNTITTVATSSDPYDQVNPQLEVTNSFKVIVREVNVPPALPVIVTQTVNELTLLTVTNTAADSNLHSSVGYWLVDPPAGVSITAGGIITWTPSQIQSPGTNTIITVATSTNNFDLINPQLSVTNSFTVLVKEVNEAPVLPVIPMQAVNEQTLFTVADTATDLNIHASLSYALMNPPAGMVISSGGVITWTPTHAQALSTNTVTTVVTSTDNDDTAHPELTATNSFSVVVRAALVLTAPQWTEDGQFEFTFYTNPGLEYTIQYSTNLTDWTSALTFVGNGATMMIIDPNSARGGRRFYRVVGLP